MLSFCSDIEKKQIYRFEMSHKIAFCPFLTSNHQPVPSYLCPYSVLFYPPLPQLPLFPLTCTICCVPSHVYIIKSLCSSRLLISVFSLCLWDATLAGTPIHYPYRKGKEWYLSVLLPFKQHLNCANSLKIVFSEHEALSSLLTCLIIQGQWWEGGSTAGEKYARSLRRGSGRSRRRWHPLAGARR